MGFLTGKYILYTADPTQAVPIFDAKDFEKFNQVISFQCVLIQFIRFVLFDGTLRGFRKIRLGPMFSSTTFLTDALSSTPAAGRSIKFYKVKIMCFSILTIGKRRKGGKRRKSTMKSVS